MFLVIGHLDGTTSLCFFNGILHRSRNLIRIHNDASIRITSCPTNSLYQGTFAPQEAFLVCIQNSYQGDFWHVQALPQEVDTHQDIKDTQTKVTDNFRSLQRLNVAMQVLDLDI